MELDPSTLYLFYINTVDRDIFDIKNILSVPLMLKIEQAKYFLRQIIRMHEIRIITQLCVRERSGIYSFANEESEGGDPFVDIDEGEDKLEENKKAAGLTCSPYPQ